MSTSADPTADDQHGPGNQVCEDSFVRRPSTPMYNDGVKARNLAWFSKALRALESRSVERAPCAPALRTPEYLLHLPVYQQRKTSLLRIRGSNQPEPKWMVSLTAQSGTGPRYKLSFEFQKYFFTKEQAAVMAPCLIKLVDRWPHPVPHPSSLHKVMLAGLAIALSGISAIGHSTIIRQNSSNFQTSVPIHKTSTRNLLDYGLQVELSPIGQNFKFPEVDCDHLGEKAQTSAAILDRHLHNKKHSDEEKYRYNAGFALVKFMVWKYSFKRMSKLNFDDMCEQTAALYGAGKHGTTPQGPYTALKSLTSDAAARGIYRGEALFDIEVHRNPSRVSVTPSARVMKDFKGLLPTIEIHCTKEFRCRPVFEALTNGWLDSGRLVAAWEAGCRAADVVNECIADGPEDRATSLRIHVCSRCRAATACYRLKENYFGTRLCEACLPTTDAGSTDRIGNWLEGGMEKSA